MRKLFNELGFSLVLGSGNWLIASHEIEEGDEETRKWGLKFPRDRAFESWYLRIWIWKTVLVFDSKTGWKSQQKGKIGLKVIFGMQYFL